MRRAKKVVSRWIQKMQLGIFERPHHKTTCYNQPILVVNYHGPVYQISTDAGSVRILSDDYVYQQTVQPIITQIDKIIRQYPQHTEFLKKHKEHIANAKNKEEKLRWLAQFRNWLNTNKDAITSSATIIATISKIMDLLKYV